LKIVLIDPFTDKRWDAYIAQHPGGTFFHHSAWAKVLQERYAVDPTYYALENEKGEIIGAAPFFMISGALGGRRMVCLPSSEYCFPLTDNPEDMGLLIARAQEEVQRKHLSYLEIRGMNGGLQPDQMTLAEHPYYLNHVTELDGGIDKLRSSLSRDTRYHINRGERSPVKIREADGEEDLKAYHSLTSSMRRRINLLPWPYRFFRSIYENIIVPGYGYLMLAETDNKVVSGGIFLGFKGTIINKFNASDSRYIQLRTNYLVMWKALEKACAQSCRYFDFGITNPENTGLIKFKRHWNSQESVLPYYYYPQVRGLNSKPETSLVYRVHTAVNRFLPDFALKLAAEILYKRLG
jgi:lipid II:glycine glycyltransferase (peptidoglycan interpeptide bridge formation enzyme)